MRCAALLSSFIAGENNYIFFTLRHCFTTLLSKSNSHPPSSSPSTHTFLNRNVKLSTLIDYTIHERPTPLGAPLTPAQINALESVPLSRIRNFSIIAHIDHGKTTLSDAILQRVGVLPEEITATASMDKLQVERDRGITVEAHTCSFFVRVKKRQQEEGICDDSCSVSTVNLKDSQGGWSLVSPLSLRKKYDVAEDVYLMNLIDTPGHVDFQYEVSRSLRASDGAILIVDVTQGIQAQTVANLNLALNQDLVVVPTLTKLDTVMNDVVVNRAIEQLENTTGFLRDEIVLTAAKVKLGVEDLLEAIVERVPPPSGDINKPGKALLFDCWAVTSVQTSAGGLKGTTEDLIALVRVLDGNFFAKTSVAMLRNKKLAKVREVGILNPHMVPTLALSAGMVGYLYLVGVNGKDVCVGDTLVPENQLLTGEALPGFTQSKPVVFAGFYPDEGELITGLKEAVERLCVTDPAVTMEDVLCPALGNGLQLGFSGLLHMQVFQERLFHEFQQRVLVTPAQVEYMYKDKNGNNHSLTVFNWRDKTGDLVAYLEPYVKVKITGPYEYFDTINSVAITDYRAECLEMNENEENTLNFSTLYRMPFADLSRGFFSFVKKATSGYGHLDYDGIIYEESDLAKVEILINKVKITALSIICIRQVAPEVGRRIVKSLKENIDKTIVDLPIQAIVGGKVVARETVGAYKKDVLAKIHAGDPTRKQKKLNDQKKGKDKLAKRTVGTAQIDQETLAAAMGAFYVH